MSDERRLNAAIDTFARIAAANTNALTIVVRALCAQPGVDAQQLLTAVLSDAEAGTKANGAMAEFRNQIAAMLQAVTSSRH